MVSFQKAFWSKIAVAGHGTRYLFRLTFSCIISIFAILLSQCLFAKRIEKKKNSHNSDDSLPINCLSSANQQCVQPASVTVFFKFSKLSVNPSWVKWCIFKTSQRSHSLERAQEVKFFPSGAVRDKNPLWAWVVIFVTSAHARPEIRNFLTSGNGYFQSPSFPNHVTKKWRTLGTRMLHDQNIIFCVFLKRNRSKNTTTR